MQPGRLIPGSNQVIYGVTSGSAQPVIPARESALAAEALELQRQQRAAARPNVVIVATPLMPHTSTHATVPVVGPHYAPAPASQHRAQLGQHPTSAGHYVPPVAAPQERAQLNTRVKKQH